MGCVCVALAGWKHTQHYIYIHQQKRSKSNAFQDEEKDGLFVEDCDKVKAFLNEMGNKFSELSVVCRLPQHLDEFENILENIENESKFQVKTHNYTQDTSRYTQFVIIKLKMVLVKMIDFLFLNLLQIKWKIL